MKHLFTDNTGGSSTGVFLSRNFGDHVGDDADSVARVRADLALEVGGPVLFMEQIHGDSIAVVDQHTDPIPSTDALITQSPGLALAVMVADCIPLLLRNESSVAAVHVGRRGLVNGISAKVIKTMRSLDSSPITAVVGPAICKNCYELSEDVFFQVTSKYPQAAALSGRGNYTLDLVGVLIDELRLADIAVQNESSCTIETPTLYSYRRDGVTGRQVGVIWL